MLKRKTLFLTVLITCFTFAVTANAQPDPEPKAPATKVAPDTKAEPKAETKTEPATKKPDTPSPASQPAAGTDEPKDPKEVPTDASGAIDLGKQVIEHGKAKQWFAMSAGIIWLVMFLFKTLRKKIDAMKKIPKRVLWIIVPLLSVAAMILAKLQADLSWGAAVAVLFSGPSVAFLNDFLKRGILNKEPSPMKPS